MKLNEDIHNYLRKSSEMMAMAVDRMMEANPDYIISPEPNDISSAIYDLFLKICSNTKITNSIKLEIGKEYKTRDGRIAIVQDKSPFHENAYAVRISDGGNEKLYFIQGNGFAQPIDILGGRLQTQEDLVEEIA